MNTYLLICLAVFILMMIPVVMAALLLRNSHVADKTKASGTDEISLGIGGALSAIRGKFSRPGLASRLPWVLLLGERDSGKTTLLTALETAPDGRSVSPGGLQWRLLDQGAISEVPGDYLVTAEGKPQTDGRWQRLLRQLVKQRPASPVNGVVLTISAEHLVSGDDGMDAKRLSVAAAIRSKLDDLQRETGLVVPVHVLVTKCDVVRGFGAFCWETAPSFRNDMFGWVNPNTLESAFLPEWVDNAFDSLQHSLVQRQICVFGGRPSGIQAEELAILPLEFDGMRAPLRSFLTEIFHETAYVDSNFFRGIFFCGDGTVVRRLAAPPAAATTSVSKSAPREPIAIAAARRTVYFARHLFDYRVFVETQIARPVTRIQFTRRRIVLALQFLCLIFLLVFGVGTARAYARLRELRDHHFLGLLGTIADTLPQASQQSRPSVQTAFNLIDALSEMQADGFKSIFVPESWGDNLNDRMADALSGAFNRTVFPAVSDALEAKGRAILGSCSVAAAPVQPPDDTAPALTSVDFRKQPEYLELDKFVRQYGDWREALRHYDLLRGVSTGDYSDLDALFIYLINRSLKAPDVLGSSYYYQRAIEGAVGPQLPITSGNYLQTCARGVAGSLVSKFYASWFEHNPLMTSTETVADGIEDLESGKLRQLTAAASLADNIRDLDGLITSSNNGWLTEVDFDPATYPALQKLTTLDFANTDLTSEIKSNGSEDLTKLRQDLLSTGSVISGAILEQRGSEVRVSGDVIALEVGLQYLLHQDFVGDFESVPPAPGKLIVWNTAALAQANKLRDSYYTFLHTQIPLLPPSMRGPVQDLAGNSLKSAVVSVVRGAQEPQQTIDDTTALMAVRSFNEAAPILAQLQATLPAGSVSSGGSFQMLLTRQGMLMAEWLNGLLSAQPLYPAQLTADMTPDPDTPMAFTLFGVHSADGLDQFLASQRERAQELTQDFAATLTSFLKGQGLLHAAGFERWAGITQDVRDYEAKKPGNSIALLENFVHADLNKINPENGCRPVQNGSLSNDYFLQVRNSLEQDAIVTCSQLALSAYRSEIADVFNAKLAGRFPFGPYPKQAGLPEADPYEVSEFLTRIEKWGPSLLKFFGSTPKYPAELAFIKACLGVRGMLGASDPNGPPAADIVVYFRVDQTAEKGGNEIIDWSLQAGDNTADFPGGENALRWHFGDPVEVSLRYAKDSPEIPMAGAADPNQTVDGRTVSWSYKGNWALFALLNQHPSLASEFNTTPEALRSTVRLVIPVQPDTARSGKGAPPLSAAVTDTKVFLRLGFRVPDAKQPREVPVVPFPSEAPLIPLQKVKS